MSLMDALDWIITFKKYRSVDQRMGQQFCNDHNLTDPELFYEQSDNRASGRIIEIYTPDE